MNCTPSLPWQPFPRRPVSTAGTRCRSRAVLIAFFASLMSCATVDSLAVDTTSGISATPPTAADGVGGPVITSQPTNTQVTVGSPLSLSVTVTGTDPLIYEWSKNGNRLSGATGSTIVISNSAQISDSGTYQVRIINLLGIALSNSVTVTVSNPAPVVPSRLTNISMRAVSGANALTPIIGFSVVGSGSKQALFRAVGPTLSAFGVGNVLPDPNIAIISNPSRLVGSNDNWGGGAALANTFGTLGAFALPVASRDSAVVVTLPQGLGSVIVAGPTPATSTGVVLVEAYDMDPINAPTRFANLSVRCTAGTNAETLIVGFAITGTTTMNLLVRGVGPSLTQFGVTGVLLDPQLFVFDATGRVLFGNNDWGGTASLVATSNAIGAFPLASPTSKDAVLQITLGPGNYTAQVLGLNNTTGVALVELYQLP